MSNKQIINYYLMGGVTQKINFILGSEELHKQVPSSFFDLSALDITGKEFRFKQLKGKKLIMIVNVASKCGATNENYQEMVKAHQKWRDSGFEILAFPCNQFLGQQSGTPEEIKAFVREKFKATFPIMEKVDVNGENTHPVYVFLRNYSSLYDPAKKTAKVIPWNFAKFFVDSNGKVIQFFDPKVSSSEVTSFIEKIMEK